LRRSRIEADIAASRVAA